MITLVAPLFTFYFFTLLVDEVYFHRYRVVSRAEKISTAVDMLILLGIGGCVLFTEFREKSIWIYAVVAVGSALTLTKNEFVVDNSISRGERWIHAFRYTLHPLMLLLTAVSWRFIDGVSFIDALVLPFLAGSLRPALTVFFAGLSVIFVYQLVSWLFGGRKRAVDPSQVELPLKKAS